MKFSSSEDVRIRVLGKDQEFCLVHIKFQVSPIENSMEVP